MVCSVIGCVVAEVMNCFEIISSLLSPGANDNVITNLELLLIRWKLLKGSRWGYLLIGYL